MNFGHSAKVVALQERLQAFNEADSCSNEGIYKEEQAAWLDRRQPVPWVKPLKPLAMEAGLWNLFLPHSKHGAKLTHAANMACEEVDRAIQAFGGAGVSDDFGLAYMSKSVGTLRVVDGPDEVDRHQLGRQELAKYRPARNHG